MGYCGAHGGHETVKLCDVRRFEGGVSCVGSRKKSDWGVSWTTSRAFRINADQWTTVAQDEGG